MRRGWILALILGLGCSGGPEPRVSDDLTAVINDDARAIAGEIASRDSTALLHRPYARVTEYLYTPKSPYFTHKAVVEFHYLSTVRMFQVRKYRYNPSRGQWERYFKEVRFNLAGKG